MSKGFTLVEILVVAFIMGLMITAMYETLNIGQNSFYQDMGLVDLQQQSRHSVSWMVKETRQSRSQDINISDNGTSIQFKIPINITTDPITYSDTIRYYLSSNQIIREYPPGTIKVLGNYISNLNFNLSGSNILKIQLEARKTAKQRELSFNLTEKIRLRNE